MRSALLSGFGRLPRHSISRRPAGSLAALALMLSTLHTMAVPVATCALPTVDLGQVETGSQPVATFKIQNEGNDPLELSKIRTACPSCLEIEWPRAPIAAGRKATIKATVMKVSAPGKLRKLLYVHTNDPANPIIALTVLAEARGRYILTPKTSFQLGSVPCDEARSWDFELALPDSEEFSLLSVELPEFLTVGTVLRTSAATHAIQLQTIPERLPYGIVSESVRIGTDSPHTPKLEVPLVMTVDGPILACPAILPILSLPTEGIQPSPAGPHQPARRLLIKARSGPAPKILGLVSPSPFVEVSESGASRDIGGRLLTVTLSRLVEPGRLGDIRIHLEGERVLRIPVVIMRPSAPTESSDVSRAERDGTAGKPIATDTLLTALADRFDCNAEDIRNGGFRDERTQLAVWLAERLCILPDAGGRSAPHQAFSGISPIQYSRARDEVTIRMSRDTEFRKECSALLNCLRTGSATIGDRP